MKKILLIVTMFYCTSTFGQITYQIEKNLPTPDLRIMIGNDIRFPDLQVQIGRNISFEDITVRITQRRHEADYILHNVPFADFSMEVNRDLGNPDLRIKAGEAISFPDVRIEIRDSGTVDYLVYSENGTVSQTEMILTLLPVIHRITKYKNKNLGKAFLQSESYLQQISCDELLSLLKNHVEENQEHTQKELPSDWLQQVVAYPVNDDVYVIADIKESRNFKTVSSQLFQVTSSEWQDFLDFKNSNDIEKGFRKYIYENPRECD
jgi:hypothetical protein